MPNSMLGNTVTVGERPVRHNTLWSIAYCSRMKTPFTDEELASLASHADARNKMLGVVGVLFVAETSFLQVLEGRKSAVRWLYSKISDDGRHQGVTKLADRPIDQRAFTGWNMRLLFEEDLLEFSRLQILEGIRSASSLDTTHKFGPAELADLQSIPPLLARGVVSNQVRVCRPSVTG